MNETLLCGGESIGDMADAGRAKRLFLEKFFPFENGILGEDTFRYVFMLMDPWKFGDCFANWMRYLHGHVEGLVAIDGKACRGTARDGKSVRGSGRAGYSGQNQRDHRVAQAGCARAGRGHAAGKAPAGWDPDEDFDEDDLYEAMDTITGHWVETEQTLRPEAFCDGVDLVLHDLTSTYFDGGGIARIRPLRPQPGPPQQPHPTHRDRA